MKTINTIITEIVSAYIAYDFFHLSALC